MSQPDSTQHPQVLQGKDLIDPLDLDIDLSIDLFRKLLEQEGIDLKDENFRDTPKRFLKYLREYLQQPDYDSLFTTFEQPATFHGMVVQSNIPFRGVCAHHLLPYIGHCSIGYIPGKRVVGLSKLSRLVRMVGEASPSIQEAQTDKIADILHDKLEPKGVIVVISSIHTCMAGRGVAVSNVPTTTSSVRGVYRDVPAARDEFFRLVNHGK